jgi:hypothetical protein
MLTCRAVCNKALQMQSIIGFSLHEQKVVYSSACEPDWFQSQTKQICTLLNVIRREYEPSDREGVRV